MVAWLHSFTAWAVARSGLLLRSLPAICLPGRQDALSESRPALLDLLPASLLPSIASLPSSHLLPSLPPTSLFSSSLLCERYQGREFAPSATCGQLCFSPAGHTSTSGDPVFSFRRPGASRHIKTKTRLCPFSLFLSHISLHYFPHAHLTLCGVAPV